MHKKDYDTNSIKHWLWIMKYECSNPRNDGFTSWAVKQELYEIKFLLDKLINQCPTFSVEQEWLDEKEKLKLVEILKD